MKFTFKHLPTKVILLSFFAFVLFLTPHKAEAAYRVIDTFGTQGSGNSQFDNPNGIDISSSTGDIFIRDNTYNRLKTFDTNHQFVSAYGSNIGIGSIASIDRPQGIAISNPTTHYISNGTAAKKFVGGTEYTSAFMSTVDDIAFSYSANKLYLAGTTQNGLHHIARYSATGTFSVPFELSFGGTGSGDGEFGGRATGIAVSASGDIYAVDKDNHRVQKFDANGNYLSQFGSFGSANGEFNNPTQIAVSLTNGNIYVLDEGNARVQIFNSSGVYQTQFGWSYGSAVGQFAPSHYIGGIALSTSSDQIYILDSGNHRVQIFADAPPIAPTVITEAPNSISSLAATLVASSLENGATITQHGFVYGLTSGLTGPSVSTSTLGVLSGSFEQALTGLQRGTMYYYRAYAENSIGRVYGDIESFETLTSDVVFSNYEATENEGSGGGSFNISLLKAPTDDVIVTLSTSTPVLGSGVIIDTTTLTFTPGNWDSLQSVGYTATDDAVYTGDRDVNITATVSSNDANYNNYNPSPFVIHVIEDEAVPGVYFQATDYTSTEGNLNNFSIALESEPTDDVIITVSTTTPTHGLGISVEPATLTFTPANWDTEQFIDIENLNDNVYSGTRQSVISLLATSNDSNYNNIHIDPVTATINDDDSSLFFVSPTANTMSEGQSFSPNFLIYQQPTDDVTVTFSQSTATSGPGVTFSQPSITITPDDYGSFHPVTITAIDDDIHSDDRIINVTATVTSNDPAYDGYFIEDIPVTIEENDGVPISISTCQDLQDMENDLTAQYTLLNNIDCTGFDPDGDGSGFRPVGVNGDPFQGIFNGNGHTISGLMINRPTEGYVGLFGNVNGGTYKDVTLSGDITGQYFAGGLIGRASTGNDRPLIIRNVTSNANIVAPGGYSIGGIVGYVEASNTEITNTHMHGNISILDTSYNIGGIAGIIADAPLTISNSGMSGNITSTSEGASIHSVGGVIGSTNSGVSLRSLSMTGNINFDAASIYDLGGLIGIHSGSGISSSTVSGNITIKAASDVYDIGGFIGVNESGDIYRTYAKGTLQIDSASSVSYVGGLVGYNSGGIADSFSQVDIVATSTEGDITIIGGLIGSNEDSSTISSSYAAGNIKLSALGAANEIGGFVGRINAINYIENSWSDYTFNLAADSGDLIGAFIGSGMAPDILLNVHYERASNGPFCTGSSILDPSECRVSPADSFISNNVLSPLDTWDFDDTWQVVEGKYPILRGVTSPYPPVVVPPPSSNNPAPISSSGGGGGGGGGNGLVIIYGNGTSTASSTGQHALGCARGALFNIFNGQKCIANISSNLPRGFTFNKNLQMGMTHIDVKYLQQFLNAQGVNISQSGAGAPGKETMYFGPATRIAVQKFQLQFGVVKNSKESGYGMFGPKSRTKANSLLRP